MPLDNTQSDTQGTTVPVALGQSGNSGIAKSAAASPWEEDIDVPETPSGKVPTVIGSLDDDSRETHEVETKAFSVPENVEEKVGQKLPAEQYINNNMPNSTDSAASIPQTPTSVLPVKLPSAGDSAPAVTQQSVPVQNMDGAMPIKPIDTIRPLAQVQVQPNANPVVSANQTQAPVAVSAPAANSLQPAPSVQQPPTENKVVSAKDNLVSMLRHAHKEGAPAGAVETKANQLAQVLPGSTQGNMSMPANAIPNKLSTRGSKIKTVVLLASASMIAAMFVSAMLTERGMISVGVERLYGSIGLERFWGGLPRNSEGALMYASSVMREHQNYKVRGIINVTADGSIKSPVTAPLFPSTQKDEVNTSMTPFNVLEIVTAATTSTNASSYESSGFYDSTSDYDWYSSYDDYNSFYGDGTQSGSSSGSSRNTTDDFDDGQSQQNQPGYQYQESTVKQFEIDVAAVFGEQGSESALTVRKISGTQNIDIKHKDNKIWVKNDLGVKHLTTPSNKWIEYVLTKMPGEAVQQSFFSIVDGQGFVVRGKRIGNEKVGNERAYRYKIDKLEVGNALTHLGIKSSSIQNISGDVWIGIQDKLIKKVKLKIATSPSSAISLIDLDLEFFDYDISNAVASPDPSVIAKPGDEATPSAPATDSGDTNTGTTPAVPATSPDDNRKGDLSKIKEALEKYKSEKGAYPVAKEMIKTSTSNNILQTFLVPDYITALPSEPKGDQGWFYGYKSDGYSFTLTARLENTTDSQGKWVNGIFLYYLYNK
ncbi:MAG: hypothetical protein BWY68_00582 [bacterium ADurb.Bin400]|nr:MAG: hypothetical protein BWY68_00582 [bacterium ADurb.Bin400]